MDTVCSVDDIVGTKLCVRWSWTVFTSKFLLGICGDEFDKSISVRNFVIFYQVSFFALLYLHLLNRTRLLTKLTNWQMLSMLQGHPELVYVDRSKCEYRFEWKSAIVCKNVPVKPDTGCKFDYKEQNVSYDLSILSATANDIQVHVDISLVFQKQI